MDTNWAGEGILVHEVSLFQDFAIDVRKGGMFIEVSSFPVCPCRGIHSKRISFLCLVCVCVCVCVYVCVCVHACVCVQTEFPVVSGGSIQ